MAALLWLDGQFASQIPEYFKILFSRSSAGDIAFIYTDDTIFHLVSVHTISN